ncbi:hypothetical protein DOY81_003028 [Sarcophaga bullata]|nr:hypothetical protein DOY81_003028 [Sarcophaga bullata]
MNNCFKNLRVHNTTNNYYKCNSEEREEIYKNVGQYCNGKMYGIDANRNFGRC